jgi:hypothetical protein
MHLLPKQPSTKGPAEMFTGDVYFDVIAKGEEPSRLRVNVVRFAPDVGQPEATWGEHVADDEYPAAQPTPRG